jgi:hypothetical protein
MRRQWGSCRGRHVDVAIVLTDESIGNNFRSEFGEPDRLAEMVCLNEEAFRFDVWRFGRWICRSRYIELKLMMMIVRIVSLIVGMNVSLSFCLSHEAEDRYLYC